MASPRSTDSVWRKYVFIQHFCVLIGIITVSHALSHSILLSVHAAQLPGATSLLDALFESILISPYVYYFVVRPLRRESSEREQAVAASLDSEMTLRTIVDSVQDALFIVETDGIIRQVNRQMLEMYGTQWDEVVGTSFTTEYPSRSNPPELLPAAWQKACAGDSQLFEWRARRPHDGFEFPAEMFLQRILLHNRQMILVSVRNISSRKRVQEALVESEEKFRTVFANAGVGIAMANLRGQLLMTNPAFQRMLGYSADELLRMTFHNYTHPDDLAVDEACMKELVEGERELFQMEKRYVRKDGSTIWGRLTVSGIRGSEGKLHHVVGIVEDISERKTAEDKLRLVANVVENTMEGVIITDPKGIILSVNPAFTTITGYTAAEAIGQNPRILKSDRHDTLFYRQMWESLLKTGQWQGEIWNRRKDGEAYPEWLTISSIQDELRNTTHYVAVFHDITEHKQNEAQIKYQAYHDALTGLPNRQLFSDRLELALAHAVRSNEQVAILFLDLDRFKTINDTLGHVVGDRLLQQVAERLSQCVRQDDTVARLGGDEFTILLTGIAHTDDIAMIARKIVGVFKQPFMLDGRELFTTPSIGISIFPIDGQDADTLIKNADTALYRAKDQGRNNYQLYTPAMNDRALERLEMENALRRALERHEFQVYYQPRFDVISGNANSAEALIRWMHPLRGMVSPGEFIPLAEETGLIVPIGAWVLHEVCRQQKAWRDAGLQPLRVAINLSARQFQQENLVRDVRHVLHEIGIASNLIELEITESVAMKDIEQSLSMLQEMHALGVYISIDDFGTGYSSLGYLKKLPVHALKIDQSFVQDIPDDQDDAAIAVSIIALARTLNLQVIAEGVEKVEQLEFLREHGCDEVQGYLYSMPLSADVFAETILQTEREFLLV